TALGSGAGEIWISSAAGNAACASVPTLQAQHYLKFLDGGPFALSGTFALASGDTIHGIYGSPGQITGSPLQGTKFVYSGPANQPVFKVFDASSATIENISVDCNNVSRAIGVQYNSDNSPPSSLGRF